MQLCCHVFAADNIKFSLQWYQEAMPVLLEPRLPTQLQM